MMPTDNNFNQLNSSSTDYSEELNEAKLQARMVNQVGPKRLKKELGYIADLKKNLAEGHYGQSLDGLNAMELHFRNLGMPGVDDTGRARRLIGLREETIKESQNLRNQGQGWQQLSEQEQNEVADRIKWGADYQNYWGTIFDAAKIDGVGFISSPVNPSEKKAKQNLTIMVGNEVELALSRDPMTRVKAKDNALIDKLSEKIAADKNFISLVNQQAQGQRNIRLIRMDIERLLKENLTNDTAGNL